MTACSKNARDSKKPDERAMSMDREALEGEVLGRVMMVRADASRAMGTGHVMRCLALCQAWSDLGGRAVFHTAPTGSRLEELLRREGVEISYAEHSAGDEDDASELMAKAQNADSSWIVQDGYHLRVDYQRRLKGSGLPLLAIDDLAEERRHSADIVLNQNMYASAEDYRPSGPETRLLLGPNYALLRRDFWRFRGRERRTGEVEHVLISFGGSDPRDLTGMALRALADVEGSPEVRAMVGPLNSRADELRSQAERTALDAEVLVGVQSMAEMLDWADLVVAAAGSSVYEFAFMGVPALMVQVADNQRLGAAAMAAKGLAVNLGWHEDITIEGLRNAMTRAIGDYEARRSMARAGQSVVDSLGAFRTVAAMMSR